MYLKDGKGDLVHKAKLKEDALEEDPTSKHGNADVPPFRKSVADGSRRKLHLEADSRCCRTDGYSKAGTATGKLVYAHVGVDSGTFKAKSDADSCCAAQFGMVEDFAKLKEAGALPDFAPQAWAKTHRE